SRRSLLLSRSPRSLRYRRQWRPPGEPVRQIVDNELAHGVPRMHRGGADMGEEDGIGKGDQLGRNVRLVGKDIETGGKDRPRLERLDQRLFVGDAAAAPVDQDPVRAEGGEDVRSEER